MPDTESDAATDAALKERNARFTEEAMPLLDQLYGGALVAAAVVIGWSASVEGRRKATDRAVTFTVGYAFALALWPLGKLEFVPAFCLALVLVMAPGHPALEPILLIQSFYGLAARLSVARGFDPDSPPFLNKVTRTK